MYCNIKLLSKKCEKTKKCVNYGKWYIFKKPLPCWNPIWLPWGCISWHSRVNVGWGQRCQGPPNCRTVVWFQGWLEVSCSWGIGLQLLLELIYILGYRSSATSWTDIYWGIGLQLLLELIYILGDRSSATSWTDIYIGV